MASKPALRHGAALLLSVMGMWFTAIIPGLDRWSKRFFLCYFIAFMLCCLSSMLETIPLYFPISNAAFYSILTVESLFLSPPLPIQRMTAPPQQTETRALIIEYIYSNTFWRRNQGFMTLQSEYSCRQ